VTTACIVIITVRQTQATIQHSASAVCTEVISWICLVIMYSWLHNCQIYLFSMISVISGTDSHFTVDFNIILLQVYVL